MNLSKTIGNTSAYKRKYSFFELYNALVFTPRAILKLIENNKNKLVDPKLIERLQLAVTEVNGCPACSYQHTKMALNLGMSHEEISSFLSGDDKYIQPAEAKAIAFAQHFADSRDYPKEYTYESIIEEYGKASANIILSAIQVIMAGNIYGLPLSAFQSRLQGKTYSNSILLYELGMIVGGAFLIPIAILHAAIRGLLKIPNHRFDTSVNDHQ